MTFTTKTWQDSPSTATPITATALIDLETRLAGYTDATVPGRWQFGDASDGTVTISTTVTLTKDTYYQDLTISGTGVLKPDGYRVFVRGTLTVASGGVIHQDGVDAVNNSGGATPGSNQRPLAQGTGGATANNTGAGIAAGASNTASTVLGGAGGTGGASGANAGGAGSSAGTLGTQWAAGGSYSNGWRQPNVLFEGGIARGQTNNNNGFSNPITPGMGGGGGATDGVGSGAGAGGGGGGFVLINAAVVSNSGRISANGGKGGNAQSNNGGGGGGGGGGIVFLNIGSALTGSSPQANGGTGGTAVGTGSIGTAGGTGLVHVYVVVAP